MCDLDLSTRYAVHLPTPEQLTHLHINLMLIGCGGTGSALAPSLARIAFHGQQKGIRFHIIFVDPDIVEESNVGRQRFTPGAEVGFPKANCLATRLNLAFGLDIAAIATPFSTELLNYFPECPRSHT
ncbi:MAG: ThiF family adenylyltransferase, partial [Anaerolineales bacterium]|nr:ThiF family adenylyltransferase [Anaerolineales bacterium]